MPFDTHGENGLTWLTSPQLSGVRHGFSTRGGGVSPAPFDSLNLRTGCGDRPENLRENFRRFCGAIGADVGRVVLAKLVHETTVRRCTAADAGKGLWSERDYTADALITDEKDLPLAVFSADCGIIRLYDPVHPALGSIHAGWRGCAGGIVEKTVRELELGDTPGEAEIFRARSEVRLRSGTVLAVLYVSLDGERFEHFYLDKTAALRKGVFFALSPFAGRVSVTISYAQEP